MDLGGNYVWNLIYSKLYFIGLSLISWWLCKRVYHRVTISFISMPPLAEYPSLNQEKGLMFELHVRGGG